jgi:hypothetical protein
MKSFKQYIPLAIAMAIILMAGAGHGNWTNRWGLSRELEESRVLLPKLPMVIGDWVGEDTQLDETKRKQLIEVGEIVGYVMRTYKNRRTGDVLSLMIVSGRPGPISTHTPAVCYGNAGYKPPESPTKVQIETAEPKPEFWKGDFRKENAILPSALRIYWSWSPKGTWKVVKDSDARLAFAPYRRLYKVYVVRDVPYSSTGTNSDNATDPGAEFLKVLMPVLQKTLFPTSQQGGK